MKHVTKNNYSSFLKAPFRNDAVHHYVYEYLLVFMHNYLEYKDRLMNYINTFTGKKVGDQYIKFSGLWFDNNYNAENIITYYALLVKI